jgi:hypothetical protein
MSEFGGGGPSAGLHVTTVYCTAEPTPDQGMREANLRFHFQR